MRDPYTIIRNPHVTEKSIDATNAGKYTFVVAPDANKIEIRQAIEAIFNVKVEKVNTVNVRGKTRRRGRTQGKTADWKKAIVTLAPGNTIDLFERA
jgi:LSU ribosomal protein L23P